MKDLQRKTLTVEALPGFEPEIGRWIWGLEDVRRTILKRLAGIRYEHLNHKAAGRQSIGSLLYHIALIEADWLYVEVLESDWDPKIKACFPWDHRTEDNRLSEVPDQPLAEHLHRMHMVRQELVAHFRGMDLSDWRRPRQLEAYDVTPEWVIYHLIEHESHHRGQIFQLLRELEQA
ncbi:DinB family protein [Paenibacillus sp. FSL H8-0457]|uniref:DinB family protein n=1 Tax=Paenibacillus TaxID=44249 RepID=UPI001F35E1B4|nr:MULTISPECIES: DinB family protein [unclassified Paenibacillus]MCM3262219.1 DinB family protein [Paenibacillus lautus]